MVNGLALKRKPMAARQPIIAFDAKMYRHFAIVTIALTGCIALFADGESREAVAETAVSVAKYEPKKPKGPTLIIKNSDVGAGGGLDGFYRTAGTGDIGIQANQVRGLSRRALAEGDVKRKVDPKRLAQLGLTMEEFEALDEEAQERVLTMLNNGVSMTERYEGIERASRASAARSGGGSNSDF